MRILRIHGAGSLLGVLSLALMPVFVHGQLPAAGGDVITNTNFYTNSYEEALIDTNADENILRYEIFAPKFPELDDVMRDADQRYFSNILRTLAQIKGELNSTYIRFQDKKQRLDRAARLSGRYFYRADVLLTTNYYEGVLPTIRTNYYLVKGLGFLQQLQQLLDRRQLAFQADIEADLLAKVTYELKTLLGVLYTFRGGTNDLFLAAEQFEYILGTNKENTIYVSSDTERQKAYYYLAGIYDRLYKKINYSDDVRGKPLIRKKLFYLWNLVELNNSDNAALKDVKLQDLANRYVAVIDYDGINYKSLYSPYVDNIIKRFKTVEEAVEDARAPEVLSTSSATEEESTAEDTEEGQ